MNMSYRKKVQLVFAEIGADEWQHMYDWNGFLQCATSELTSKVQTIEGGHFPKCATLVTLLSRGPLSEWVKNLDMDAEDHYKTPVEQVPPGLRDETKSA